MIGQNDNVAMGDDGETEQWGDGEEVKQTNKKRPR